MGREDEDAMNCHTCRVLGRDTCRHITAPAFSTERLDVIVCPHCGSNEGMSGHMQTRTETIDCRQCGNSFACTTHVETAYSTRKA